MKINFLTITILLTANTLIAQISSSFRGYDDLAANSPQIIVARCVDVPKANAGIEFDVEVIDVLKGNTKPGHARVQSLFVPRPGDEMLIFSEGYSEGPAYWGYTALEDYCVVPLKSGFTTNELTGKTLMEQVRPFLPEEKKPLAATPSDQFISWDKLIDDSTDILLARCTGAPWNAPREKHLKVYDSLWPFDIDVLLTLKGNAIPGPAKMGSTPFWPEEGEQFLIFANFRQDRFVTNYTVAGDYRAVLVDHSFNTNELSGKSLHEKIEAILAARLEYLNGEIARAETEKSRLETWVTNGPPRGVRGGPF